MPCFKPLQGWKARIVGKNGKRGVVFNPGAGFIDLPVSVPCGGCIGCRIDRSQMWATRVSHEAQLHEENCFITLTYRDRDLPRGGTLVKRHFQDFMRRLRRHFRGRKIGFFHCGEYGEQLGRPHYHAILFNVDFPDKTPWKTSPDGSQLWTSPTLERLWGFGFTSLGACTFQSAAYCARYVLKKITGDAARRHYERVDPHTGEVHSLQPEYMTCSLKPAIGKGWIEAYKPDVYPDDFVVVDGVRRRVPRYYDKQLEVSAPGQLQDIKTKRIARASKRVVRENSTPDRLRVREEVTTARTQLLKRDIR